MEAGVQQQRRGRGEKVPASPTDPLSKAPVDVPPASDTTTATTSTAAASPGTTTAMPTTASSGFNDALFIQKFTAADAPGRMELITELGSWLKTSSSSAGTPIRLSAALYGFLVEEMQRFNEQRLQAQLAQWEMGCVGEAAAQQQQEPGEDDGEVAVIISLTSLLLHHVHDLLGEDPPVLFDIVGLLRSFTEEGMVAGLERELVFDPIIRLLSDDRSLQYPELLANMLHILHDATTASASSTAGEDGAAGQSKKGGERDHHVAATTAQLVTLGVIPNVTHVAKALLRAAEVLKAEEPEPEAVEVGEDEDDMLLKLESEAAASGGPGGNGLTGRLDADWLEEMVESIALIYRNLSIAYPHHVMKMGGLDTLVLFLFILKGSSRVVEASARALAKLVFDADCLAALASNPYFMKAALIALQAQLQLEGDGVAATEERTGRLRFSAPTTRPHLMLARLAGAMARVAESDADQLDILALCGAPVLLALLKKCGQNDVVLSPFVPGGVVGGRSPMKQLKSRRVRVKEDEEEEEELAASHERQTVGSAPQQLPVIPFVQAVVWLAGVAAMSTVCSVEVVLRAVPMLLQLLEEIPLSPQTRPTILYTLMAISNLSYFFGVIDCRGGDGKEELTAQEEEEVSQLKAIYESLGLSMAGILVSGDAEASVEATRTLSNMVFTPHGSDWAEQEGCDELLIVFMGHEDLRLVYNCAGALLNLTASTSCRVVSDPELLRRLLLHTSRFTSQERIQKAAMEEVHFLQGSSSGSASPPSSPMLESTAASLALSYASQIAELVERLLQNVNGLLQADRDLI